MNVLHINPNFPYQTAHSGLVRAVAEATTWSQTVYVPKGPGSGSPRVDVSAEPYDVIVSQDFRNQDRLFQSHKTKKILRAMQGQLELQSFDLVHAHTLISAGKVALLINELYGTPFVVSVRNTDLNGFLKRPWLFGKMGAEIADGSEAIVSINPSYKKRLDESLRPFLPSGTASKTTVIPNGIDDSWLNETPAVVPRDLSPFRILFVGEFTANKNLDKLIEAAGLLDRSGIPVDLTLIGRGPSYDSITDLALAARFPVHLRQWVDNSEELRDAYRQSDVFAMPSRTETFGLVYVEALSQGIPVIYTRNEGFDGFFVDGQVGFGVDDSSPTDIFRGLRSVAEGYDGFHKRCAEAATKFSWPEIAKDLASVYTAAV